MRQSENTLLTYQLGFEHGYSLSTLDASLLDAIRTMREKNMSPTHSDYVRGLIDGILERGELTQHLVRTGMVNTREQLIENDLDLDR
jgi:hypothetical protein